MLNLGLGRKADAVLETFLREWNGKGYRVDIIHDESGSVFLKGATDSGSYTVPAKVDDRGEVIRKAYKVKARTIDPARAGFGFTEADVDAARALLRQAGVKKTWDEVDALLCEAQWTMDNRGKRAYTDDTLSPIAKKYPTKAEYHREKRRRRIAKLREMGVCIMCGREYVEPTRATCYPCGVKANARKKSV